MFNSTDFEKRIAELAANGIPVPVTLMPEGKNLGMIPELYDKNGERIQLPINNLQIGAVIAVNNGMGGVVGLGHTADGYGSWGYGEKGGGGSVIVPYAIVDGTIVIGCIEITRGNRAGQKVLELPRGALQPGKNHFQTAMAEFDEEVGVKNPIGTPVLLKGNPVTPNSSFWFTQNKEDGVQFFSIEIPANWLESNRFDTTWKFKEGVVKSDPESNNTRLAERITGAKFIPLGETIGNGDAFTEVGISRLIKNNFSTPSGLKFVARSFFNKNDE